MSQAPPPPPPHGENPRTTAGGPGLPPGKYDVFIIPEHSAGSGFLYLPSLKPQWNSFIAGVVSTLAVVIMSNLASPMVLGMFSSPDRMWSFLWATLVACVGVAAFLFGRHNNESWGQQQGRDGDGSGGYQKPGGGYGGARSSWYTPPPPNGPPPNQAPPPPPPPPPQHENSRDGGGQYHSWHEQPRQQPQPEPQPQPQAQPKPQPQPQAQPKPEPEPQPQEPKREMPKEEPAPPPKPPPEPKQPPQSPHPGSAKTEAPKGAWEKAREEMRRREEERKAKEEEARKKESAARRLRELREREAREREKREREARERELKEQLRKEQEARERERLEREVREKVEKELREKAEKEAREREALEREAREREAKLKEEARKREEERARQEKERQAARERERKEREERLERLRKEQAEREKEREREREREKEKERERERTERRGTAYAYSSVGEKTSMWPNGKPPSVAPSQAASTPPPPKPSASQRTPSPSKPAPAPSPPKPAPSPTKPTASATGTEDTYSYRPYDKPKKPPARKKSVSDFSESSWAPSASTARTTPPPSTRGPYTTNDPQKIVIKAVYGYLNQFSKTPASQLISGVSPVTDGLILRVTSAGLFVDDDVRGVAQREWDIKAWTLKLVEVWCPVHAASGQAANTPGSVPTNHPFFKTMPQSARRAAERGATKTMLGEEAVAYIEEFGRVCDGNCRRNSRGSAASGDERWKGLHLLRATIRDQEGKRFLFVVGEDEAWKIAGGLAALRGSSQVRALGVAGFSGMETKTLLDTLGWGG